MAEMFGSDDWAREKLLAKFKQMHAPLPKLANMHDTARVGNAMQVQEILLISTASQRATAAEILNRVREEVATRNAMSMRGA